MISVAWAQDAAAAANPTVAMLFSYLPLVFIFVIFYMLIIRPQNQAAKAHAALLAALKKGDSVQTQGGLIGTVDSLADDVVSLRIAADVVVKVARVAVMRVLTETPAAKPMTAKPAKGAK